MAASKVLIGTPNRGDIKFDTHMSLLAALSIATYDLVALGQAGPVVDFNRNVICHWALGHEVTHICFMDTDMVFPSTTINQLLALAKPVVGVASRKKKLPRQYTIEVDEPNGPRNISDEELPAEPFSRINGHPILVGTGIMLIDLQQARERIPKPWFKFNTFWEEGKEPGYTGEDLYFCRKTWAAGLEVWCDPTIKIGHIGDFQY